MEGGIGSVISSVMVYHPEEPADKDFSRCDGVQRMMAYTDTNLVLQMSS